VHHDSGHPQNVGTADLVVGDPTQNACFQWSDCHQHYHFKGVGKYTLYAEDGTTVVAIGHKQGFCIEDVEPIPALNPPPANPAQPNTCTNQGLHVGWEDIYPNNIDCQWVDITGVPPGNYVLSVIVNSQRFLPESNYDNNEARVPVIIPAE
jgi:Lysyl oxidase